MTSYCGVEFCGFIIPQTVYPFNCWNFKCLKFIYYQWDATNILVTFQSEHMRSFPLGIQPGEEKLSYIIGICLVFEETAKPFSKEAVHMYLPTSYVWGQFSHFLANTCWMLWVLSIVEGVWWYTTAVCIP